MNNLFQSLHSKDRFDTWWEYKNLEKKIANFIEEGFITIEEPIQFWHPHFYHLEKWYKDVKTEEIYRYIPPDFPFPGVWESVKESEPPSVSKPNPIEFVED